MVNLADIALEAFIDTLKALPFLFVAYLLLEWLAHRAGDDLKARLKRFGRLGSVGGALLGLVPQCGFSVAAAEFYSDRVITPGTLIAVFVATSDEALPILLSPGGMNSIMPLIAVKLVLAVSAGLAADLFFRRLWQPTWERDSELRHDHHANSSHDGGEHSGSEEDDHCHHSHCEGGMARIALVHTLGVGALIFAATFLLDAALMFLGEEQTSRLLLSNSRMQPVAASLFGLLPSCAVSVFLANLYLKGSLTFGSVVAGLSTGAGMGSLVLLKACRKRREAFALLFALVAVGSLAGIAIDAFGWHAP